MSHEALIQDLQQKSGARIKKKWLEAEARAAEIRTLKEKELERRQAEELGTLKDEAGKVAAPILHEAKRSALLIEDEAMRRLSERLYTMAVDLLSQIRQQDYEAVFAALAGEIPVIAWERIQVNPQDTALAGSFFPGAEVDTESSISGGFRVSTDGGRYQVINTFERRLEKGWQAWLPLLLEEIIKEKDAKPAV